MSRSNAESNTAITVQTPSLILADRVVMNSRHGNIRIAGSAIAAERGWATFDDVSSLAADIRQRAAITNQFKPDGDGPFYVVQMEITQPVSSNIGFVGKQTEATGSLLRGGGTQIQFDEAYKGTERNAFLKVASTPKPLQ